MCDQPGNPSSVIDALRPFAESMRVWRRHLHAIPELAFQETETASFIAERLRAFGYSVIVGIGDTGVIGSLTSGTSGRVIGLRAELDGLPMTERGAHAYRSRHSGQMHACGHDGHMAMLLGAAQFLAECGRFDGTVRVVFQPAEEGGGGARRMLDEGLLDRAPMDAMFGMHNRPGLAAGTLAFGAGLMMAAYDTFVMTVRGRGAHAAQPHQGTDAIVATAQLILAAQHIVSRETAPLESAVVSVTSVEGGAGFNVLPDQVQIRGTVRALSRDVREASERSLRRIAAGVAAMTGLEIGVVYERRYPPLENPVEQTNRCATIAEQLVGPQNVRRNVTPTMGAEDFAFFLDQRPGCFCWIGNGPLVEGGGLHGSYYDFNDDILITGAAYWVHLTQSFLPRVPDLAS